MSGNEEYDIDNVEIEGDSAAGLERSSRGCERSQALIVRSGSNTTNPFQYPSTNLKEYARGHLTRKKLYSNL